MSGLLHYLSHPEVQVDPDVPVPQWSLSEKGRRRVVDMASKASLRSIKKIVSSAETKAVETAEILACALGIDFEKHPGMHENDRTSTGFLPSADFEKAADTFFAEPQNSFKGWETAAGAQARIVGEVEVLMTSRIEGDLLVVGHGAVGTLLYCHFAAVPIDRKHDQSGGGGNFFSVDLHTRQPLHHWRPVEQF